MKKKGFTLIELLAVIVILAIIALIAIPLILKYIEKSREEAAVASAYSYIDAYEKYVANSTLQENNEINKKEKYYLINNSNYKDSSVANKKVFLNNLVKVKGQIPDDGYLITRDKTPYVKQAIFLYDDIEVECKNDKCYIKGRRTFDSENDQFVSMIVWDGWVTLTLYYPENSIDRQYRIGEPGEVREEDWKDYEGSITIPLEDIDNVYIKYKLADKVVIIPPKGEIYVDIEPSSYTISEGKEITFKINATEGSEVYYKTGSEWIKYETGSEITHNTYGLIEAKAVMDEKVYRSDGSVSYTRKITAYDSVYINPDETIADIMEPVRMNNGKIEPSYYLSGPTITVSPTELATSVTVTLSPAETARKIYIKIGNGSYEEYTEPVTVSKNTYVYAYYVTEAEGRESSLSYANIINIYKQSYKSDGTTCNLPNVYFTSEPEQYNRTQEEVIVTLNHNAEEAYYSYDNVNWTSYTESIEVTENKRIYGKATNDCGKTETYIDVRNIRGSTAPEKRETLEVDIMANPESSLGEYVDKVEVTINYSTKATTKKYQIGSGELKDYEGPFEVEENTTIYAYASSENGYGSDYKLIDNIGSLDKATGKVTTKGHASPVIVVNPSSELTDKVTVTIHYDKNATAKLYKIGTGTYKTYNGTFIVDENTTITAYSKDSSTVKTSSYEIDNIKDKLPVYLISKGNYYIIKLNYPDSAKNKEYKYGTNGEWKKYGEDGILLVTKETNINTDGIIKIEDENGEEVEFNGDYIVITTTISEVVSNLFMRWDAVAPTTPVIVLDTEESASEVKVTINYGLSTTKNQYKIVTPDGKVGNWTDYKNPLVVTQKNTTIYARSISSSEMYSEEAIKVITNIDKESPVIKLAADFDTLSSSLSIKVTVTDDVKVDTVMYDSGNRSESYFKTNGKLINNNSIVSIKENGDYTFFAKDSVGNTQIYTIKVENIDNIAPEIDIQESPTDKVGIESTITIDYKDSTTNKYKIGESTTTWIDYTESFIVTSDTVLANNAKNEDGSYTICAQAIDSVGNVQEVCKKIYNLDLDMPDTPIIYSSSGYPTLTANGIVFDDDVTIYYGTRTDVDNYYSLDGETWILYTGKFNAPNGTIYAKSVKKNTGLTASITKTISMPSNSLGVKAYDGDTNTYHSGTSYINVDPSMLGKKVYIKSYIFYGADIISVNNDGTSTKLESQYGYNKSWNFSKIYTLPTTSTKLYFKVNGSSSKLYIYEISTVDEPQINVTNKYPILTSNGIEDAYNLVTISYFDSSVQKLYKIDDGEWQNYRGETIRLEHGKTIYAKGINSDNIETRLTPSYTSAMPSNGLGVNAYDDDTNTYHSGDSYIDIAPSMQGKKIYVKAYLFYGVDIISINNDGTSTKLESLYAYNTPRDINKTYTLPTNSTRLYFKRTNSSSKVYVYEIKPVLE